MNYENTSKTKLKKEQQEAVYFDKGNILVSASAGSGKTFVMIERILRLVKEKKAKLKEILAVTFTELAAQEMKEKLKSTLSEEAKDQSDVLKEEIADIYTADISTLHSFCVKLLRRYFYATPLSPDFSVCDQTKSDNIKSEALNEVLREEYEKGEEWFLRLVLRYRYKRSDDKLKKLIFRADEFVESEAYPEQLLDAYDKVYTEQNFENILKEFKNIIDQTLERWIDALKEDREYYIKNDCKKHAENAEKYIAALTKIVGEDIYCLLEDGLPRIVNSTVKEKEIASKTKNFDTIKEMFADIKKRVVQSLYEKDADKIRFLKMREETEDFIRLLKLYTNKYSQLKREENVVDFNDLEHFALKILSVEEIRNEIKSRYKYIFVDEYQDTNSVQEEILKYIASDNLFMVGDVKQSIYGFRGCRPDIFEKKLSDMQANGEKVVYLNDNFRSAQKVIDFVNVVFGYSMTNEFYGKDYKPNSELKNGGLYGLGSGRAFLHHYNKGKKSKQEQASGIYDIQQEFYNVEGEQEQADCSFMVAAIIREELGKTYFDIKSKTEKAIKFSDIALLSRTNEGSDIAPIAKGLIKQGIPVSSAIKHNVCCCAEIITLINALKLIDCFRQDIPLCTVMKSPIGNFSEEDLAYIVAEYNSATKDTDKTFLKAFDYFSENGEGAVKEKIVDFVQYIKSIRFVSDFSGAKGALEKLLADSDYENCMLASQNGELKVKRIRKFLSEATQNGVALSVRQFLRKIETSPKSFELSSESGENTVKAMTIHASKGLEFPVVILCGMEMLFKGTSQNDDLLCSRTYGLALKSHDEKNKIEYNTALRGLIDIIETQNTMKEYLRLFYVAATRAKYSLHLTYVGDTAKRCGKFLGTNRTIGFVPDFIEAREWTSQNFELAQMKKSKRSVLIGKSDQEIIAKMKKSFGFEYKYALDTALPLKKTVTELNSEQKEKYYDVKVESGFGYAEKTEFAEKTKDSGFTDTESGIIAHKILQLYDFDSSASLSEQIDKMISGGIIIKTDLEKVNVARLEKALNSEQLKSLKGKTLLKEQEFLVNVPAKFIDGFSGEENVLLQGVIDLVAIDGDNAQIIDYKYSALNTNLLKKRYSRQLSLYAYATEKVLGINVRDKILVNIFSGEIINI